MLKTITGKLSALNSELVYRKKLWHHAKKLPVLESGDRLILDNLKKSGVHITTLADLGLNSTPELLQAALKQLSIMTKVNHDNFNQKLPHIYQVTDLPEFSNWGNEPRLLNIIEKYIGLPIIFHGVHLRKDFPNEQQFGTLLWHKDSEDRRMIKIIIYLTDVEKKHGPFEYLPISLTSLWSLNYYRIYYKLWQAGYVGITDEELKKIIPESAWKSCPGEAGTVIIVDPKIALHHGTIRTQERATLFFAYTANPPKKPDLCNQYWDNTYPRPELETLSS
ncbi:phytanoyl-CoA dioxygenase family protein [Halotia branconii]|uniref:Phytanoyl-CoA dioxygenase family protein n=1 Tax=Halotia branconii CENA392 TaxID=1539056 RepID=A0AAJ6NWV7_9CYAN|nr:phytanoyl-CoA dioxygenase family protein [Halotia branconii]WGV28240.1 phytanoyl-CoA dioxygenase family protein [Halotia branconii CENA392]